MNVEQSKFQLDNLVKLSKNLRIHTTVIFRIDQKGDIKPELTFKNEAAEVVLSKELLEKALAGMNNK